MNSWGLFSFEGVESMQEKKIQPTSREDAFALSDTIDRLLR